MAIAAAGSDRPPPAQAEAWGLMTVCAGLRGDLDEARNGYRSVLSVARLGRGTASKICVGAARWLEAAEAGHPLCAEIYEHLIAQEESQVRTRACSRRRVCVLLLFAVGIEQLVCRVRCHPGLGDASGGAGRLRALSAEPG